MKSVAAATMLAILGALLSLATPPAGASAGDGNFTPHPSLVPDVPATGYPVILDTPANGANRKETEAVDLIDRWIVSGGSFQNIELQDGTVISQPFLSIVDTTTKQQVCTNLDVNNEITSIAPGPVPNSAIIGGRFDRVNGADGVERVRNKIALIHLDDCSVDINWVVPGIYARVSELAVSGNRLFIGGDFTNVGPNGISHLLEVNHSTGQINNAFDFDITVNQWRPIVGLDASPDGTRLGVVHRGTAIDGNSMRGTAVFNIADPANPTLTPHRMATNTVAYSRYYDIMEGAISPGFSSIVLAMGTSTASDYVYSIPTGESAGQFGWEHYMRDTSFSIAVSNNAVYVGGHFCKIDEGPGPTEIMAPNGGGPSSCTGTNFPGGAWRSQLAALNPADGTPLTWNPGNDAYRGVSAITVVSRGLLVGYDGLRTNFRRVGTTAFFDFGAPAEDPRTGQTCTTSVDPVGTVTLDWTPVAEIDQYDIVRNGTTVANLGDVATYSETPAAGTYTYVVRSDLNGVSWDTTCSPNVTINPPAGGCTATLNPDDTITLSWDPVAGVNDYVVRRNGSWIASPGDVLTYTDNPGVGTHTYVIRTRPGGQVTDTTCNPTITVENNQPGQTCAVTTNPDGSITLDWTEVVGEDRYVIRKNGSWLASVDNALTYTDATAQPGDTYLIRSRMAGTTTNTDCV